ncbi:hypothetical protein PIB30_080006 [Stylosanthes scabra]|uniref:Putative plant transposon protein domain-containing protein n=1 Tax=Stylosanthes scabra TaxID=79078 RepID=A0ABU6STH4_9FABA|nr:hypothetical protein [Stylosanthes scabra]
MASSSAPVSVFDEHRFRKEHNQQLFESYARRRKVIPEVAPRTSVSKLLVQQFYANATVSDKEASGKDELPYKSFVRGKEVNFSPSNIRRVMRFKRETAGAETDYNTRKAIDQRLDEVLRDLCVPGATWKLSSSQPAVPIQLKRIELHPLAKGEDVRAEDIIADNMATIAQGLTNKGNLAHPSTINKLCKDAGVPLRDFSRTPRIPKLSYIMAKRMETIRFPRNQPQQQHEEDDEDEPMPQADGGNHEEEDQQPPQQDQQPQQHGFPNFQPRYESQYHEDLQGIEETLSSMQFFQQTFYENMQKSQVDYMEETNNTSSKEAYACWAQQQTNPNLSEIPITQIPDIMRTNVEKRRPLFYGCLKSDYGASSSSQVDPQELVPLRTAPPSPHFRPPHPLPN